MKTLAIVLGLISLCVIGVFGYLLLTGPKQPLAKVPSPNAYQTLLQASAKQLRRLPAGYHDSQDLAELTVILDDNEAAFSLIDQAAEQSAQVPPEDLIALPKLIEDAAKFKGVLRLVHLRARVRQLENATESAVRDYRQLFRHAGQTAEGGLMLNHLGAIAFQSLAIREIEPLVPQLAADQRAELAQFVDQAIVELPSSEEITQRELDYVIRREGRLRGNVLAWTMSPAGSNGMLDQSIDRLRKQLEALRQKLEDR
ncbi:MAG: hypothetical protein AAGA03_12880 [Planctomycetota bacterium]